jgi:LPXTG-site transpeptidase (sortase) family protein
MPAVQLEIPSVGIAAKVVESRFEDGDFPVPKFAIGHLDSSAMANQRGNGVYYGHVESISSGNVFAPLDKVSYGDKIILSTVDGIYTYFVSDKKTVPFSQAEVMAPTNDTRVTLITCAGTWDAARKDYSHRLVVVGLFMEGSEFTPTPMSTSTNPPAPTATSTSTSTPTRVPTATSTTVPTNTPTRVPVNTPTRVPTNTPAAVSAAAATATAAAATAVADSAAAVAAAATPRPAVAGVAATPVPPTPNPAQ